MQNSNYTLRFNRTARQAFGHSLSFDSRPVWIEKALILVAVFVLGVLIGALI